ncbi:hypothetical protein [Duganella radicis]|uniref:Uncharacterized protein n=1 Tax=Duganella radicis TaxID=551988 RepID=A0A6L6PGB1_9BURK|nr:hypothetical protein [Duganella radicis]MTV38033.1 hypothetical protein [Duganella radicis]
MRPMSLLDNQLDQSEHHSMATFTNSHEAALNDLTLTVKVMESNYATKEALATLSGTTKEALATMNGKIDLLASNQQAFQVQVLQTFATKADLANVMYQLTWRMAGFTLVLMSTIIAAARYL